MNLARDPRQVTLSDAMLHYFTTPRRSLRLHLQPEFQSYTPSEVRKMLYALDRVGLIAIANGKGTRGAIYHLTARGRWLLRMKG